MLRLRSRMRRLPPAHPVGCDSMRIPLHRFHLFPVMVSASEASHSERVKKTSTLSRVPSPLGANPEAVVGVRPF